MLTRPRNLALIIAVAFALAAQGHVSAQTIHQQVIVIQIESVMAADTNEGVDPRLGAMGVRLRKIFNYSTYVLVNEQNGRAEIGKVIEFSMPGGRVLHVEPQSINGNMIAMEVLLFQGEKPMLTTDLKMPNKGWLIVGGPHYQQGELIIEIGANTGDATASPTAASAAPDK